MWVKLCNMDKYEPGQQTLGGKHFANDKSVVSIQVCDRVFKVKKNPLYRDNTKLMEILREYLLPPDVGQEDPDNNLNGPQSDRECSASAPDEQPGAASHHND